MRVPEQQLLGPSAKLIALQNILLIIAMKLLRDDGIVRDTKYYVKAELSKVEKVIGDLKRQI